MARAYRMTSARRAAIRKAQLASARKRRGRRNKRIATGVGVGVGVVAVTLGAAAHSYGKRRRGRMQNVVQTTVQASNRSTSKELDVVRWTLEESIVDIGPDAKKKKLKPRIDFGRAGKTPREIMFKQQQLSRSQWKQDRAKKGKNGRGRVRVAESGKADKVLRDRQKFNAQRRESYDSNARAALYESQKGIIKIKNDAKAARKRRDKALRRILSQQVVGNITIDMTGTEKSGWPIY